MQTVNLSASQEPAAPVSSNDAGKTFLPVANGSHFNGNGGAASTALIQARCRQSRKLLRVIAGGARQLQVEWANIWTTVTPQAADASCELPGPNAVTARMSVEYPAGNPRLTSGSTAWSAATAYALLDQVVSGGSSWVAIQAGTNQAPAVGSAYWRKVNRYPVRWEGDTDTSGTVVFAPGDYKKSIPAVLLERMIPGDCIAILGAFDSGNSSNYIPYAGANGASNTAPFTDWVVDSAGGLPAVGSSIVDTGITTQTNGNTTTLNSTNAALWMKIPYATAITGDIPTRRCVGLFGDSLIQGTGGDIRDGEPAGIFVRSLDGSPWWRVAQGGNRAQCYVPGNFPWQQSVLARCSAVITNMAVNDISNGGTFAQVQGYMGRMWQAVAATGAPLYAGLLSPISNSSDAWATLANQSRFTNGGTIPTTQYPTDDASFLTSVYGLISLWLSQDGATMTLGDGSTAKFGQQGHPLDALLDWKSLIADPATSWKWNPGYTTDGAHPIPAAVTVQAAYLAPQMEAVLQGRQQISQSWPQSTPQGEAVIASFPRTLASVNSPSTPVGSFSTIIGVSPGRYFYGFRCAPGAATPAARNWTLLAGMDAAKLKVIASGSWTPTASTIQDTALPSAPVWIPAGYVVALVLTVPATVANVYVGVTALVGFDKLNQSGPGFVLAGKSTDVVSLTGTKSLFVGVAGAGVFAASAFRVWAEMY